MRTKLPRVFLLLCACLAFLPVNGTSRAEDPDDLKSAFLEEQGHSPPYRSRPAMVAFDYGEAALPFLEGLLFSSDQDKSQLAAYSIALIGGTKAVGILKKWYDSSPESGGKFLLCFAMGSTGTKQDIDFLIGALPGPHYGSEWPPIEQAAFSLGILRAKEARIALEKAASKKEGFASSAARYALKWSEGDMWSVSDSEKSPRDAVIDAMFRFGVPRLDESNAFSERASDRIWRLKNGVWTPETVDGDGNRRLPEVSFDVHFAPDSQRAICSVSLWFGPLNGNGYDLLLRKKGNAWQVVGLMATWVS